MLNYSMLLRSYKYTTHNYFVKIYFKYFSADTFQKERNYLRNKKYNTLPNNCQGILLTIFSNETLVRSA